MTKAEVAAFFLASGYKPDAFGHMQCTKESGTKLRVKLQATSFRLEVQGRIGGKNEWVRRFSCYYSKATIKPNGKIAGPNIY